MPDSSSPALRLNRVGRAYDDGRQRVDVLKSCELSVNIGEKVAIMGASGSGKSTLLHLAAGMDLPDSGHVEVLGRRIDALAEPERTRFRARHVGLIFQDYNLIGSLSALDNIELIDWLIGQPADPVYRQRLVGELGIDELMARRPDQLSGGQQQRVAIARALIHRPALVLADEPTGSLDQATGLEVLDVLTAATASRECALVLVTHNLDAAQRCDRILALREGRLEAA